MFMTAAGGVCRGVGSLLLAWYMTGRASSKFEAIGFVVALIAYHRIGHALDSAATGAAFRQMRIELWCHRLDWMMRGAAAGVLAGQFASPFPGMPAALTGMRVFDASELEDLVAEIEEAGRARAVRFWIAAGVEILLLLGAGLAALA